MPNVKTHVLNLEIGDRFSFEDGGPVFKRVQGPDDRVWIQDDKATLPAHRLDYSGCFVHAIDPFETFSEPREKSR